MPLPPRDHRLDAGDSPLLLEAAARAARRLPDGALVLCGVVGLVAAAAALVIHPPIWLAALPALALAGFGTWGVADRMIGERDAHTGGAGSALRTLRFAAGLLGVSALVATALLAAAHTVLRTGSGWF